MDVDGFDDVLLRWQNQFDALPDANVEFPAACSAGEIFLDDFPEIKEDITGGSCVAGSDPADVVPSLPSLAEPAYFVPSPVWAASGLQVITPACVDVSQPRSGNSSRGRFSACASISEVRGELESCVTEEIFPSAKRKRKFSTPRVSRKKVKTNVPQNPVKQFLPQESNRLPTPEEHILRERKRRVDMAERFRLLEKILPPDSRRQKSLIIEDAIKLVKCLQLRKEELLKRRAQMKLMLQNRNKSERSPQFPSCQSERYSSYEALAGNLALTKLQVMQVPSLSTLERRKPIDTEMQTLLRYFPHGPLAGAKKTDTNHFRELLQIHAQVSDDEILVEMLFHQYSTNVHTRVVRTVEAMELEVIHCSLQRTVSCGFVECIITTKPLPECQSRRQDTQSSALVLVGALQAAFRHVEF